MQRDPRALLQDVVEAADAIAEAIEAITLEDYRDNQMIRSSVEREFIIIGEVLTNLSRLEPELFAGIEHAARIISFRNKLTHEYAKVDRVLVWGVIQSSLNPLRTACWQLACR
jgi:uncharacterized protein with HEPN domain